MLPLQDVIPSRTTPWVTVVLVVATTFATLGALILPDPVMRRLIFSYGVVPAEVHWVSLPVATLLHAGLIHGVTNIIGLVVFGDTLEDRLGHARFTLLCGGASVTSAMLVAWASPQSVTPFIGATGMVAAVMAGYLVLLPRSRVLVLVPLPFFFELVEIPAAIVPLFWGLLQLIGTAGQAISASQTARQVVWAMIGGGLTGAVAVRLLHRPDRAQPDWWSPMRGA